MKKSLYLFFGLFLVLSTISLAETPDDCRIAIKSGNAKALTNYFANTIELVTDDEEGSYSKTQAGIVLSNFFKKHPASDFRYDHKGTSPGGLKYYRGTYVSSGTEFLVYFKMKQIGGKYLIDTFNISEE